MNPTTAAAAGPGVDCTESAADPPQVICPGPQVPELGGAVIAAAMPALVVIDDLDVLTERCQRHLDGHMVKSRTTVNSHQSGPLHRGVTAGNDGRPGYVKPETHVTKADPHQAP